MATPGTVAYFQVSTSSFVRGFHVYMAIWSPVMNAEHSTQQEYDDLYAVAVMNDGVTVEHVSKELSQTFWFFIERGGEIICKVRRRRQRSVGGMEIPCVYTFMGKKKLVDKHKEDGLRSLLR